MLKLEENKLLSQGFFHKPSDFQFKYMSQCLVLIAQCADSVNAVQAFRNTAAK